MDTTSSRDGVEQHFAVELFGLIMRVIVTALASSLMLGAVVLGLTAINQAQAATEEAAGGGIPMKASEAGQGVLLFRSAQGTVSAPTLNTDVTINVGGPLARARVVQVFENPGDQWQEGVYVFPLPENAAVDRLRMRVGVRVIVGEVHERGQARAIYEKARDSGQRAALLEQERPNLFTTNIANIGPGQRVIVEIEYQQTLSYEIVDGRGRYSLRFPMVAGPRYIPGTTPDDTPESGHGWAQDTDQVPDASRITPPVRHPSKGLINPVALRVNLDAGVAIASVSSAYHTVYVERDGSSRRSVELADGTVPANRDFELNWTLADTVAPTATLFMESTATDDYALLMLVPPMQNSQTTGFPREVVFVVDTSGSMYGLSMKQAREALALALKRLKPQDSFNVIEFNSQARPLFVEARPASSENLDAALDWVARLEANGGTEMFGALNLALDGAEHPGLVRQIVFLTDGSVGNEDALFGLIERKLGDSRLFTVGIGSAPNSHFMRKAAQSGRGTFTYIGKIEEVRERMTELFAKLESPVLKGISVDWGDGVAAESWPQVIPDLYLGEPLVVSAALGKVRDPEQARITVSGASHSGVKWQSTMALRDANLTGGIGALWARQKIDGLLDSLREGANETDIRTAVVELALRHQLVSKYTSLVAVDKTPARAQGQDLHTSALETNLPEGWDHNAVFGELPRGATSARMHLLAGCLALLLSLVAMLRCRRIRGDGAALS